MTDHLPAPSQGTQSLSATEQTVADLWREVLQTSTQPRPIDNFFDLGGDSMTMVMLEFRLQEEFSVELPVGAVLTAPTIRELSSLVEAATGG